MDELLDDETAARSLQVPVKLQTALRRSKLQGGTKFETEAVHENAENTDNNHYHKIFAEMSRLMKSAGANSEVLPQNIEDFQLYSSTMVDVSPMKDLGIMKKILRSGSGDKVEECRVVRFHYTCWLEGQDEPFDCSRLRNRVRRVRLNGGGLITGLYYGLLTMNVGELADFIITSDYAWGSSGIPEWSVPGNSSVRITVDLMDISEPESPIDNMSEVEQMELPTAQVKDYVDLKKSAGRGHFTQEKFGTAYNRYKEAADLLESRTHVNRVAGFEEKNLKNELHLLYSNMAMCLLKLGRFHDAKKYCQQADNLLPGDGKVLYRWAKSLYELGDWEEARKKAKLAQTKNPNNYEIEKLMLAIHDKLAIDKAKEKENAKRMFKSFGSDLAKKTIVENGAKQDTLVSPAPVKDGFRAHIDDIFKQFATDEKKEFVLGRQTYTLDELEYIENAAEERNWNLSMDDETNRIKLTK